MANTAFAQSKDAEAPAKFYLYYGILGLGSNMWRTQPVLRIHDNKFTLRDEEVWTDGKHERKSKLVSKGTIRQRTIDSILWLVQPLRKSTVYKCNFCVLSGAAVQITVAYENDTTHFTLYNTFDSTALKITKLLNPYLPKQKQFYLHTGFVQEYEDCLKFFKDWAREKER